MLLFDDHKNPIGLIFFLNSVISSTLLPVNSIGLFIVINSNIVLSRQFFVDILAALLAPPTRTHSAK